MHGVDWCGRYGHMQKGFMIQYLHRTGLIEWLLDLSIYLSICSYTPWHLHLTWGNWNHRREADCCWSSLKSLSFVFCCCCCCWPWWWWWWRQEVASVLLFLVIIIITMTRRNQANHTHPLRLDTAMTTNQCFGNEISRVHCWRMYSYDAMLQWFYGRYFDASLAPCFGRI